MSKLTKDQVEAAVKTWIDPYSDQDPVTGEALRGIKVRRDRVRLDVELGYPAQHWREEYARALAEHVRNATGAGDVEVRVDWRVESHSVQGGLKPLPGIKNLIAVASGKGGVGKSTTAVNLALALAHEGARVGMLDADIYGPSQPRMLGVSGRPESSDGKRLRPLEGHGLQTMSIGFLVDEESPMVWRGPMVTQALTQLLNDTEWRDLDYLIVDLPPGTGDIQLTLAQRVPVSGAVIVTTPQDIALLDARKGLRMFEKVKVPVLGIVENMSTHICSQCGHEEPIFGAGGGEQMAKDYDVTLLGALPLDIRIREGADSGRPTVVADPDGSLAQAYIETARRAAARLARKGDQPRSAFPKIVVQDK